MCKCEKLKLALQYIYIYNITEDSWGVFLGGQGKSDDKKKEERKEEKEDILLNSLGLIL